ncbi:hypothetical protein [uncultured Methanobrevibacter sp.]|uniref:hypothetical protein n=1 Tax=uncultured Methanobrevibacter sp. TaxID=253161 RepID=UPI0025F74334|nr:hypothetical protein [uncultured Methanobrevibacter sp.]
MDRYNVLKNSKGIDRTDLIDLLKDINGMKQQLLDSAIRFDSLKGKRLSSISMHMVKT